MSKKWMARLQKLEGAVTDNFNPYDRVVRTTSPSVNFCFGNTWGLPLGFSLCLYGPPKSGKSLICNSMISQLHKDYSDAIAIKYNTEFRERGQLPESNYKKMWDIDPDRYIAFETNTPEGIFDAIEHDVAAMCEEGAPVKLVFIDSVTSIQGRRALNAKSISTQQIGDHALTVQDGLKRILPIQRKYGIALVLTCQVRAEMDQIEQKRGNKVKMSAGFGVQHHCEYFMYVEKNRNKEGRTDLLGKEYIDESLGDINDNAERTGHKIKVCMKDSSMGPPGRIGEFTLDYRNGVINVHEEVFRLGINRGVIERPNNTAYIFGDNKWVGKESFIEALKNNSELQNAIIGKLMSQENSPNIKVNPEEAPEFATLS